MAKNDEPSVDNDAPELENGRTKQRRSLHQQDLDALRWQWDCVSTTGQSARNRQALSRTKRLNRTRVQIHSLAKPAFAADIKKANHGITKARRMGNSDNPPIIDARLSLKGSVNDLDASASLFFTAKRIFVEDCCNCVGNARPLDAG
ncbi:hypothetical protein FYK55_23505 [Roseiconus nitratireducens]|uniref:Uncharacterized protein n=1 Tax=Roseiconus nitratireducens TaxID=2605748 RepID=A0A5M6CX08_9BACT|nr:hypothetical protein [Roseiconus nitratireducens]KAA5539767.1 hypothetical protein FYK55_23505 [Roseiconus nitratireducens]